MLCSHLLDKDAALVMTQDSSSSRQHKSHIQLFFDWGELHCGIFCVLKERSTNHFSFVGTHFKTSWDSKGMAMPLALGFQ